MVLLHRQSYAAHRRSSSTHLDGGLRLVLLQMADDLLMAARDSPIHYRLTVHVLAPVVTDELQ